MADLSDYFNPLLSAAHAVGGNPILQIDPMAANMLQRAAGPPANDNVAGGPKTPWDVLLSKAPPPPSEDSRLYNQAVLQQQWNRVLKQLITEADRQAVREQLSGPDSPVSPVSNSGITGHAASPANFDTFDSKFIGTGMGHNYNGEGFYFSANPGYASAMRQQYFPQGKVYTTQINAQPHELFNLDAKATPGVIDAINKDVGAQVLSEMGDRFREMNIRAGKVSNRDVLSALEDVDTNTYRNFFGDYTISTPKQGASRYLGAAGYKANTYSDSYGQHYVVYDPKDIYITNKQ